jgi:hypothetical protein
MEDFMKTKARTVFIFLFFVSLFPAFSQDDTGYGSVKWGMSFNSFSENYRGADAMSDSRERVKAYRIDLDGGLSVQFFFFDDRFFEAISVYSPISANNAVKIINSVAEQYGQFDSKDEGNNILWGHAYNYYRNYSGKMKIEATIYEGKTISVLIRIINPPIYKEMQKIYPNY